MIFVNKNEIYKLNREETALYNVTSSKDQFLGSGDIEMPSDFKNGGRLLRFFRLLKLMEK